MLAGAEGVDRNRRLVLVVLTPVDEHFVGAHGFLHVRDNQLWMLLLQQASYRMRERFRLVVTRLGVQRDIDLHSF